MNGRGRGRPAIGAPLKFSASPELTAALDVEAKARGMKRAELLRVLVEDALGFEV